MDATNLADLYELPLLDWGRIKDRLDQGVTQAPGTGGPNRHTCWLATINRDGSPHVTGVGALWVDDARRLPRSARSNQVAPRAGASSAARLSRRRPCRRGARRVVRARVHR